VTGRRLAAALLLGAWSAGVPAGAQTTTTAGPFTLILGGQARWREEFVRGFFTLPISDGYGQSRLLLASDLTVGRKPRGYGRLFVEARDAQSYGRTLPGGVRPVDADRADFQTAFVDLGRGASLLRVGRQEIALGRERLFGAPDWANTRRSSQGARLLLVRGPLALELVDARPIVVRLRLPNLADSTQRFRTLSLGSAPGAKPLLTGAPTTWQLYWIEQRVRPPTTPAQHAYRITSGGRAVWQWAGARAVARSLEVETARQLGSIGTRRIDAGFWVVEAQGQWKRRRGAPSLALGVEGATGDHAATADRAEAFTMLYPAAHQHGGYADVFGRANLRELHAIAQWVPVKTVDLRVAAYRFDRRRLDDGVYLKQGAAIFRPAGTSRARHVADEVDVTGSWRMTSHLRFIFGGALVAPGAFLRETLAGTTLERWGFLGTTATF
jgi:hypothetical protein